MGRPLGSKNKKTLAKEEIKIIGTVTNTAGSAKHTAMRATGIPSIGFPTATTTYKVSNGLTRFGGLKGRVGNYSNQPQGFNNNERDPVQVELDSDSESDPEESRLRAIKYWKDIIYGSDIENFED